MNEEMERLQKEMEDISALMAKRKKKQLRLFILASIMFFVAAQPLFLCLIVLLNEPNYQAGIFFGLTLIFAAAGVGFVWLYNRNKDEYSKLEKKRSTARGKLAELRRIEDAQKEK
ncbi:MAG: hypothetical protein K6F83_00410 [Clostridiales bacterium]|nr:hypothetical protein [Clostridiales bacterium]